MKEAPVPESARWTARVADDDEGRAGALLRRSVRPEPLGEDRLAALGTRLARERRGGLRTRTPAQRVAFAFGMMVLGGALVAAAMRLVRGPERPQAPVPVTPAPAVVAPPRPAPPAAEPPLPEIRPDAPAPPRAPTPPSRPRRPAAAAPAEADEKAAPAPLAEEAKLLERALRKLRQEHDPQGALALLDDHRARFAATGVLGPEAERARIEALVQMRRHREALALLEPMALAPSGATRELLATRAELRAATGGCADALADFDALLAGAGADATDVVAERALFGRAGCRARRNDPEGARADLERYLERFPDGRFAEKARTALDR